MTRSIWVFDSLLRGFFRVMGCLSGVVIVYLSIISICCTSGFFTEATLAHPDAIATTVGGAALWGIPISVILFFVILALVRSLSRVSVRMLVFCLAAIVFAGQILLIVFSRASGYGYIDSIQVLTLANSLANGDYPALYAPQTNGAVPYLMVYPFQSNIVILFSLFFSLFGSAPVTAIALFNAAFNTITFLSIVGIAATLSDDEYVVTCASLLAALFLPLIISCNFIYGNEIGCGCSFLALYVTARALRFSHSGSAGSMVVAFVLLFVGLFAKPTFSIFLIAITVIWVIYLLKERRYATLIPLFLLAAFAYSSGIIGVRFLEGLYGGSFGDGMPRIQWIAMGLSVEDGVAPGWWTPTQFHIWESYGFDSAATAAVVQSSVQERLLQFCSNPPEGFVFFNDKLISEWTDPTFQTIYYSSLVVGEPSSFVRSLETSGSPLNSFVIFYLDGLTLLVFFGAALAVFRCWFGKHAMSPCLPLLLVLICFFGGFLCFVFWEAKPIYVLPYFMLLIPLAASSINWGYTRAIGFLSSGRLEGCSQQ